MTHGVTAKAHALHWDLIFPASTARKKMFMFKVYMVENILGWACLMWTLRGHLSGAMGRPLTSNIGPKTNQTTFMMKTVFTLLVSSRVMNTNGTMWIAQTATDSPARKVRALILLEKELRSYGIWVILARKKKPLRCELHRLSQIHLQERCAPLFR